MSQLVKQPNGKQLPDIAGEAAGREAGDSTLDRKEMDGKELAGLVNSCDAGRVEAAGVAHEPLSWPTPDSAWWWMRCRLKPRGKWRILLVEFDQHQGTEYVRPHQDNNCYPRSICADWQAQFLPGPTPPTFE